MKKPKLTSKIAAKYFGCNVIVLDNGPYPMVGLTKDDIIIKPFPKIPYTSNEVISYCKLVLIPLSKITDNHLIEVAKLLFGPKKATMLENAKVYLHGLHRSSDVVDYLRSKHYDMDELIEFGLAVPKTRKRKL